jgi:alkanesulfonate monooxygenase SsuD/methylene tetrahydromethanopterin reductase-like flavin-dependent oxidoreductase (luciferase family)
MKYGLAFPNFGPVSDVRLLAEIAREADTAGWDGFFLADSIQMHGYESSPVANPWIALTAVALATQNVRIGLQVSAPTRRRPWQLALEATTLDRLSDGRLILGVGLGDEQDRGFTVFGEEMDLRVRAERLDETLAILEGLWSGTAFTFAGKHFQVNEFTQHPTPVQQPRIPIWVGWRYPRKKPLTRAARWDGAIPFAMNDDGTYALLTPEDARELGRAIAERRSTDTPYDLVIYAPILDAHENDEAQRLLTDLDHAGATWVMEYVEPEHDLDEIRTAIRLGPPNLTQLVTLTSVAED